MQPKTIKLKSNREVQLREPTVEDAQSFTDFINQLVDEQTFEYAGKQTLQDEIEYIGFIQREIHQKKGVHLIAVFQGAKIAGIDLTNQGYKKEHIGELQLYVRKDFRGEGLGKLLLTEIEKEVQELPNIKVIIISSFANNTIANNLYKKFGYKPYGELPKAIHHKEEYVNELLMYKEVNS
jgi:RimJ/RimL family protein N-acetyltransferase